MPLVQVRYSRIKGIEPIVFDIARFLPSVVASHLSIQGAERHQGLVLDEDVIVEVNEGSSMDVNAMDFHIVIFSHNFSARVENGEDRKNAIFTEVRLLVPPRFTLFVQINLIPTLFACA